MKLSIEKIKQITAVITLSLIVAVSGIFVGNYNAGAQSSTFNVVLRSQEPIYTWADARYSPALWSSPFASVEWLPGGYFVSSGVCTPDVGGLQGGGFESGGMYVFDDEGNFIDKENVCWQTAASRSPCPEGGGCALGLRTHPISEGVFIRENTQDEASVPRSPLVYRINQSEVVFDPDSRLWFDEYPGGDTGDILEVLDTAYANGMLIAIEKRDEGVGRVGIDEQAHCSVLGTEQRRWGYYNTVFSVPSMNRVASFSVPHPKRERPSSETCGRFGDRFSGTPSLTDAKYEPLFGVNDLFVALNSSNTGVTGGNAANGALVVYRMPSAQNLLNGVEPEMIQVLRETDPNGLTPRPRSIVRDSLDPNRIGLVFEGTTIVGGRVTARTAVLEIYDVTASGFVKTDEIRRNNMATNFSDANLVAMAGDVLAYTSGAGSAASQLIVEKGGVQLSVEPLPVLNIFEERSRWCGLITQSSQACPTSQGANDEKEQGVASVAIAPNGNILVTNKTIDAWGQLYIYTIGGTPSGEDPSTGDPSGGTGPILDLISEEQLVLQINSLRQRVTDLLRLLAGGAPVLGGSPVAEPREVTVFEPILPTAPRSSDPLFSPVPNISTGTSGSSDGSSLSVLQVQQILNRDPDTRLAESGPGSPGNETNFLGPLTRNAIERFQCKQGIVCSGTPTTTGYGNLGPLTRAALAQIDDTEPDRL